MHRYEPPFCGSVKIVRPHKDLCEIFGMGKIFDKIEVKAVGVERARVSGDGAGDPVEFGGARRRIDIVQLGPHAVWHEHDVRMQRLLFLKQIG